MENKKEFIYVLLICAITGIWFVLLFSRFQSTATGEWDLAFTQHEIQRKIILQYRQFPLWNPYLSGGEPWLAHPESNFLSPFFIFVLLLGTIKGTLAIYFFHALAGLLGMYFLSRYYGLERILSLLNAVLFLNIFNMLAYPGVFPFSNISFIPWIYLFFNKSKTNKNYIFYTAILIAFIMLGGSIYILTMGLIILFIDAVFYAVSNKKPRFLLDFAAIFCFVLLLGGLKLIPMLELLKQYPRIITLSPSYSFFDPTNIWNGLKLFKNFLFSQDNTYNIYYLKHSISGNISHYYFVLAIFVVFISSCVILWKKYKMLVAINIIFALLFLGDYSPINLWRLLHFFLPSIRGPHKFFTVLMMTFSLSVGLTIHELQLKFPYKKVFKAIVFSFLLIIAFHVYLSASIIFPFNNEEAYRLDSAREPFFQTKGNPDNMFKVIYKGQGNISNHDRSDVIGNQIKTKVLAKGEAGYRGEYYLLNGSGQVEQVMFSPNKLAFKLKLKNSDRLVINQNYFPGWHVSVGRLKSLDGLLSVSLNKSDTNLALYYLPGSFLVGIFISFLSLCLVVYILYNKRKKLPI